VPLGARRFRRVARVGDIDTRIVPRNAVGSSVTGVVAREGGCWQGHAGDKHAGHEYCFHHSVLFELLFFSQLTALAIVPFKHSSTLHCLLSNRVCRKADLPLCISMDQSQSRWQRVRQVGLHDAPLLEKGGREDSVGNVTQERSVSWCVVNQAWSRACSIPIGLCSRSQVWMTSLTPSGSWAPAPGSNRLSEQNRLERAQEPG
jgi:hypothetical protein